MKEYSGLLVIVFIIALHSERADAYLDSGSASMIIQMAVGAVVGALVFIKLNWFKLTALARRVVRRR